MTGSGTSPRWVVAAGTGTYDHNEPLPCVAADVNTVTQLFTELGYSVEARLLDRTVAELRRDLSDWAAGQGDADGALVLYYSGHGTKDAVGRHYVLCRDSRADRLMGSALATDDLVGMVVEAGVQRLLLILDTCYAGQGGVDAVRDVARVLASPKVDHHRLAAFTVIAASRPGDLAQDGAFARALRQAVEDPTLGGQRQPKLYVEQVVDRVNEVLGRTSRFQRATWGVLPSGEGFPFLPNPRYVPEMPGEGLLDLAEQRSFLSDEGRHRREEFLAHFGPRSRGVGGATDQGFYFTGRAAALDALRAWVNGAPEAFGRAVTVTGSPGVGKSSLLGRLVVRAGLVGETLPRVLPDNDTQPGQRVQAAIHARHKSMDGLVAAVADAAGHPGADLEYLLQALRQRTEPLVIVVDALDEAGATGGGAEPQRIAEELLAPLATLPGVRLAVGTRPHLLAALGPGFSCLNLDEPQWATAGDLEDYAHKLLLAPDGPGSQGAYTPLLAAPVAEAIARLAHHNYLVARLVARALARAPTPLDTAAPDWQDMLPRSVPTAFHWALTEQLGAKAERARALLLPLALAEGVGLPGTVWPAMAAALSGAEVTAQDIRWVLEAAGTHIVEVLDARQRSVYRLYHESFADDLRARIDLATAQTAVTRALLGLVRVNPATGRPDWQSADHYLRAHLATHAAACGRLDNLVHDPGFLLSAEFGALHRAFPTLISSPAIAARSAFQRCAALLHAEPDTSHQAAQLHLAAVQEGADTLAEALRDDFPDRPWEALWALTSPTRYRSLGPFDPPPSHLAVLDVNGRRVIVTFQTGKGIQWWDHVTGEALGQLPDSPEEIASLSTCADGTHPWLLVEYRDGDHLVAGVRDLSNGGGLGPPITIGSWSQGPPGISVAAVGGRCVAAIPSGDGVTLTDMVRGDTLTRLPNGPRRRPHGTYRTALGSRGDQVLVAAGVGGQQYDTSSLRPRNARVVVWEVTPGQGWRVTTRRRVRGRGNALLALTVSAGQVQMATAVGYRMLDLRFSGQCVVHHELVREWCSRDITHASDPHTFAHDGVDRWLVRVQRESMFHARPRLEVLGTDFRARSVIDISGENRAWAVAARADKHVTVVSADPGPALRVWDIAMHSTPDSGGDGGGGGDESQRPLGSWNEVGVGRTNGRTVLATATSDSVRTIDPHSGAQHVIRLPSQKEYPILRPAVGGPHLPLVFVASRGSRRQQALVVEETEIRTITLTAPRWFPELEVVSLGGEPLLLARRTYGPLVIWNLKGDRWVVAQAEFLVGKVEFDGSLLLVSHNRMLGVYLFSPPQLPGSFRLHWQAPDGWLLVERERFAPRRLPDERAHVADVGTWAERPAIALARYDASETSVEILVCDLTASNLVHGSWRVPHRFLLTERHSERPLIRFLAAGGRDALLMATSDQRLVVLDSGSATPTANMHIGADIHRFLPVDDHLVGILTTAGLTMLQLPPSPSPGL